jgi:hypothetical protein
MTWRLLRMIRHHYDLPWLCVGDFNEVLFQWEKVGRAARPQGCLDRFREALEGCGLHDLGLEGDAYTWRNNSHDPCKYIKERLDQAVANKGWCAHFPEFRVINGDPHHSDHRPIIIDLEDSSNIAVGRRGPHPFRFEALWLEEENCKEVMRNAWEREVLGKGGSVNEAIKGLAADLTDWSKTSLGQLEKRIAHTKKELEVCRRRALTEEVVHNEHMLRYRLKKLETQWDTFWKQRAHVNWLEKGDGNSKFFHAYASERRRRNHIKKLKK